MILVQLVGSWTCSQQWTEELQRVRQVSLRGELRLWHAELRKLAEHANLAEERGATRGDFSWPQTNTRQEENSNRVSAEWLRRPNPIAAFCLCLAMCSGLTSLLIRPRSSSGQRQPDLHQQALHDHLKQQRRRELAVAGQ